MASYIANIGSYLLGTTQHCGLRENTPDFRQNTRSITINPFMAFLYWHLNWHIEHHMYAGVPCYKLKALAKELAPNMPQPRTLPRAWKEMRTIWRRQVAEPSYEFRTPVPAVDTAPSSLMFDELANSIGDLAPRGSGL